MKRLDSLLRIVRGRLVADRLTTIAWACHYLGISWLFFRLNRRRKRILTYHNVLPDDQFSGALHQGLSHSAAIFSAQISHLSRLFLLDTDLDNSNSLTVTFDDGYLNQYAVAHPILTKLGVRAYFFCPLLMWETGDPLLTDRLLCWLSYVPFGTYPLRQKAEGVPLTLSLASNADRRSSWERLSDLLASGEIDEETLYAMFDECFPFSIIRGTMPPEAFSLRFTPISDHALAEMRAYGHQIGAHGRTHRILALMNDDTLDQEVVACAGELGSRFNTSVFSYPVGGLREVTLRVLETVKRHGFTRAVSNINEPLTGELRYSVMFLPRLCLPNTADRYVLSFILSGAKYFLQNRSLLPRWS